MESIKNNNNRAEHLINEIKPGDAIPWYAIAWYAIPIVAIFHIGHLICHYLKQPSNKRELRALIEKSPLDEKIFNEAMEILQIKKENPIKAFEMEIENALANTLGQNYASTKSKAYIYLAIASLAKGQESSFREIVQNFPEFQRIIPEEIHEPKVNQFKAMFSTLEKKVPDRSDLRYNFTIKYAEGKDLQTAILQCILGKIANKKGAIDLATSMSTLAQFWSQTEEPKRGDLFRLVEGLYSMGNPQISPENFKTAFYLISNILKIQNHIDEISDTILSFKTSNAPIEDSNRFIHLLRSIKETKHFELKKWIFKALQEIEKFQIEANPVNGLTQFINEFRKGALPGLTKGQALALEHPGLYYL